MRERLDDDVDFGLLRTEPFARASTMPRWGRCMSQSAKKEYRAPTLMEYGLIGDHTFTNPGGHLKNGQSHINMDTFGELAGNPHPAS
jgi:hypothetical protein